LIGQFEKDFRGKVEVTAEEVGIWLEQNSLIVFDEEKVRRNFRVLQGRRFISTIKDKNGVREWFSYRDEETDQRLFAKTCGITDLGILQGQREQLEKKRKGLEKSIKKVDDRIYQLNTQQTIYDFIPNDFGVLKTKETAEIGVL